MTLPATIDFQDTPDAVWDVAIIGAGPAGSVAACVLARRGLRTLLIDRAQFPRGKVCGGCLNPNALTAFAVAGLGDVPVRLGAVPLRGVQLASGGRLARIAWPGGVSLSREALDVELIREAIAAGAEFLPGTRATMGELTGDGRSVHLERSGMTGEISARVVIVADGLNGQQAAAARSGSRIGAGTMIANPPSWCEPGIVYMASAPGGYVGLVLVEGGRLDVAAAFDVGFVRSHGGLGPAADAVLRAAGFSAFDELAAADWKGTPALTRTSRRVAGERWFAIGDAAGYVEPFTGEGIGWAVSAAVAVAPLAVRGAAAWQDTLTNEWTRTHRKVVGQRQTICRAVAWALRRPRLCGAAVRILHLIPTLARPVIDSLQRPTRVVSRSSRAGRRPLA